MSVPRDFDLAFNPDDALERLRRRVRSDRFLADLAVREHVVGAFSGSRFRLRCRGGSFRIVFSPSLVGEVKPSARGCVVRVSAGTNYFVSTVVTLFLGLSCLLPILGAAGVPIYHRGRRMTFDELLFQAFVLGIVLSVLGLIIQRFRLRKMEELWNLLETAFSEDVKT